MKTKCMFKTIATTALLSTLILIIGCQSPGKIVSTQTSDVCPQCEMQTVTTPIKGFTYTRHICPSCKTDETDEAKTSAALASYTSMDVETVHVCENCKALIEPCPACSKM
jgi:hypothetical protein